MKANPWDLIRGHYATLTDQRDGSITWLDHFLMEGLPVLVAVGLFLADLELPQAASIGLLTVTGLLAAFFFGALLQISQRAMSWADQEPALGKNTTWNARFLEQTAANAGYAGLVSILTAAVFVAAAVAQGNARILFSAIGLGLALHLVLMLCMVMIRVFRLAQTRLTDARTGNGRVPELPTRKAG